MRGATRCKQTSSYRQYFNPRSSCEERPLETGLKPRACTFQSTLLMRGATSQQRKEDQNENISIHAPHARSDGRLGTPVQLIVDFNPRSSCEERLDSDNQAATYARFQSTLLMRGATRQRKMQVYYDSISIHAPHARSDAPSIGQRIAALISIHAPHARSDDNIRIKRYNVINFNPRSSCEEQLSTNPLSHSTNTFQSTLLMRGATVSLFILITLYQFQSTLLMRGATRRTQRTRRRVIDFNPRSSCEERLGRFDGTENLLEFQSTLLMRGATGYGSQLLFWPGISIHAPHARSDEEKNLQTTMTEAISIHAPHARSDARGLRAG